jgi:RNA polymerase sigma factor (sigma-70 family)
MIPRHDLLTKQQEKAAFTMLLAETDPDRRAELRNAIIEKNLRFAIDCANCYYLKYRHVHMKDLHSYAMQGLFTAVDKYDPNSNVRFTSYAVFWVKSSIVSNVQKYECLIRYPANILKNAEKGKYSSDECQAISCNTRGDFGISMVPGDSGIPESRILAYSTPANVEYDRQRQAELIEEVLKHLPELESAVVRDTFGLNPAMEAVSNTAISRKHKLGKEGMRKCRMAGLETIKHELMRNYNGVPI